MNILIFIPARLGSKRLSKKNVMRFGDSFLSDWTVEFAKAIKLEFEDEHNVDILLSTNDEILIERYKGSDILINKRDEKYCLDDTSTASALAYELDRIQNDDCEYDCVSTLQLTNPFRSISDWKKAFDIFINEPEVPCVSVRTPKDHPYWCFKKTLNKIEPIFGADRLNMRSQDLPKSFVISGLFYFSSSKHVLMNNKLIGNINNYYACEDECYAVDIDDREDLDTATAILENLPNDVFRP